MTLTENVIDILAKDTPPERLCKEEDLLDAMYDCVPKDAENPSDYVMSFNGALAR